MRISPATDHHRDAIVELIVARQREVSTACAYLGTERAGVLAELEDLDPSWTQTLRVALDERSTVVGAVVVDYDEAETGRSWIHGPWTTDPRTWDACAGQLVDAAIALTPAQVTRHELCAAPAHTQMASLAATLGWHPTEVSIAYVARTDATWPARSPQVRAALTQDLAQIEALHMRSFPDTYATASQLLADPARTTVVVEKAGVLAGYASGEVQADGAGYLDYLAVHESHRGRGVAAALLAAVGRDVMARAPQGDVNLTVVGSNTAAIALYESFGFTRDSELIGYRSWGAHIR